MSPTTSTVASVLPLPTEYAPYYAKYISLVPRGNIVELLDRQLGESLTLLRGIREERSLSRQPPYTWSFKEVLGHVIDAERVFAYRALRFARNDSTPLPGFDQDPYVRAAKFDACPWVNLVMEFEGVRRATVWFFRNLDPAGWERQGIASDNPVTVRAIAHIIAGHERHHIEILRTRCRQFETQTG